MTASLKWSLVLCFVALAPVPARAATLQTAVKSGVAQKFGVPTKGISVSVQPALQRAPAHVRKIGNQRIGLDLVPHSVPSKTKATFVAKVPDAPARAGFSVTGTIIKTTHTISGMHRQSGE